MTLLCSVMWQPFNEPGLELCHLSQPYRWHIEGTVLTGFEGVPARVIYGVTCSTLWHTEDVWIRLEMNAEEREMHLSRRRTHWNVNRERREDLAGFMDIDLGVTPATNTLPIRRLNLSIGESRKVTAAWVRFPSLTVEPLVQTYTRLGEFEYRYASPNFETRVLVDDLGLVVEYEKGWRRVASSGKA